MTAKTWSVQLDLSIEFVSADLLNANDAHLKRPSAYYGTLWVSMMSGSDAPLPVRITFERVKGSPTTLRAKGYSLLMTGSDKPKHDTPWPSGGLQLAGSQRGIPTAASVELVLLNEVASHDMRIARDTIGSAAFPLQQLAAINGDAPYRIDCPIVLRATQEVAFCTLRATVNSSSFDHTRLREVYDAAMQPHVQAVIMHYHASLGWVHMVKRDFETGEVVNPVALDGLTEVASKSIVPFCNDTSGVVPVDFFFDVHNHQHYPVLSEERWLRIAEHAFWMRDMPLTEVATLLENNLQREHAEPRFESVMSGFAKIFALTANAMPYRSDELRARNQIAEVIRTGTDDFRSALTQLCGDCEDLAKCAYEMFTLFSAAKFENPMLRNLQRLGSCFTQTGGLFDVTSAKLEQNAPSDKDSAPAKHKFVPLTERKCGLHAATFLYPKHQLRAELARTTSTDQADQLNLRGDSVVPESEIPRVAKSVGMIVLEGTGSMDARMFNHRHYVTEAAKAIGTDAAKHEAEQLSVAEETRIAMLRKVYVENAKQLAPFGFKPEMAQFAKYEYDYEKLYNGDAQPISGFYVAGAELFTTVPLKAGQRHCRFAFVTTDAKNNWLKTAMFDSIVAADARVALMPQPPITDHVYKCAQMLTQRLEPVPFIDEHVDDSGPDALLQRAEQVFGKAPAAGTTPKGLTRVDLFLYNRNIDAEALAEHLPALKTHLEALPYVRGLGFRIMDLNAGLVTGALRILVDPVVAAAATQASPALATKAEAIVVPEHLELGAAISVFGEVRRHVSARYTNFERVLRRVNLKAIGLHAPGHQGTVLCPDNESFHALTGSDPSFAEQTIDYFYVPRVRITSVRDAASISTTYWKVLSVDSESGLVIFGHYTKQGSKSQLYEKWSMHEVLRTRNKNIPTLVGIHLEEYDPALYSINGLSTHTLKIESARQM